ncbi:MAG TPA: YciI family protein [Actinomycetota bacterium]|nr:YciI family protein [Actinomycetota bacterium]
MRVMMMIKGDPEPGAAPGEELLAAMGRYNDELQRAGVLLDLAGLLPSAEGRRVKFAEGNRAVIDGPFPESKALIAGYWILQVQSMDEAVEWAKRAPFEALSRIYPGEYGATGEIEIRRVFELEGVDASSSGG